MPPSRLVVFAVLCVAALLPSPSEAAGPKPGAETAPAPPAPTPLDVARQRADKGGELYDAGRYAEAMEELRAAHALIRAPTIELYMARCQTKLGRLLEAKLLYQSVIATTLSPDATVEFRDAQRAAESELVVLEMQIPKVKLVVRGAVGKTVEAAVDGVRIASVDTAIEMNPGEHAVEVNVKGEASITRKVTASVGKTEEVIVDLTPPEVAAKAPATAVPAAPSATGLTGSGPWIAPTTAVGAPGPSPLRLPAWGLVGVGAVGLAACAITGATALLKYNEVMSRCDGANGCVRTDEGTAAESQALAIASTTSLAIGGAAAVTGVILFVIAGKNTAAPKTGRWLPAVGPGTISFRGEF